MQKYLQRGRLPVAIFCAAIMLSLVSGFSADAQQNNADSNSSQTPTVSPTPAPSPTPIPLSDVVAESERSAKKLQEIQTVLSNNPGIAVIEQEFPALAAEINTRETEMAQLLSARPSLETLRRAEQAWQSLAKNTTAWRGDLRTQAALVDKQIEDLRDLNLRWQMTLDALTKSESSATPTIEPTTSPTIAPKISPTITPTIGAKIPVENKTRIPAEVFDRINQIIASTKQTQRQAEEWRARILTLQSRVSEQETQITSALESIKRVRGEALSRLLVKDSPAIWNVAKEADSAGSLYEQTVNSFTAQITALSEYAARQIDRFVLHAGAFILLFAALFRVRRRVRPFVEKEPQLKRAVTVLQSPAATALILTILLSGWFYPQAPRILTALLGVAALVPVVILLRRLLEKSLFPVLDALMIFYLIDRLREITAPVAPVSRLLFLAEMLGAIVFLAWFLYSKRLSGKIKARDARVVSVVKKVVPAAVVMFAVAALAGALGYVSLANIIGNGVLASAYIALFLYTGVRILESLIVFAFRVSPLALLEMVKTHRRTMRETIFKILKWAAVVAWAILTLQRFSVWETVYNFLKGVLTAEFGFGSIHISLGDVLAFGITIWLAFAISRFVRFVLNEEIYPRVDLAGGLPYAISTVLNYVILLVGFLLAIGALGFDLTKFTVLAGAFGVGIGFGLQTIVNNFVSGLILLFERPVKVGDAVQLKDYQGALSSIGLRASILRTPEGAEVIVPNSRLISEEVVNCTFSDRQKKIEINVGAAYGSEPERVIEILTKVAAANENILDDPTPRTFFVGFGASALDFQLRAWTSQTDRWEIIGSELAVGVHAALQAANIEIPFPQRDLHLKSTDTEILKNKRED